MRSPEYVSREEFRNALEKTREEFEVALDAAVLQTCREIADDRKRITLQEENSARQDEFSKTLYSILWMRMKSTRMEFEAKLRKLLPCASPISTDQSTEVTD